MESGHSYLPNDRDFSVIEKKIPMINALFFLKKNVCSWWLILNERNRIK